MVYIAYNYSGKVVSIVNARSLELAHAYWQGKGVMLNNVKTLEDRGDFIPLDEHPTGVYSILETEEKEIYIHGKTRKYLLVK